MLYRGGYYPSLKEDLSLVNVIVWLDLQKQTGWSYLFSQIVLTFDILRNTGSIPVHGQKMRTLVSAHTVINIFWISVENVRNQIPLRLGIIILMLQLLY